MSPMLSSTRVRAWQSRLLDTIYPILCLNALQVKVKSGSTVRNKAIYLTIVGSTDEFKDRTASNSLKNLHSRDGSH